MVKKNLKILTWINAFFPPVLWAGVIFLFSSQQALPGFDTSAVDFIFKKVAHMFVYAVLYLLLARGVEMVADEKSDPKVKIFVPLILVLCYAVSDEIHQSFVPNRYATLRDVGYDILGSSLVILKKYKYI
jgi:VanZ family protein